MSRIDRKKGLPNSSATKRDQKQTKCHCNSCQNETVHNILKTAKTSWEAPTDPDVFGSDTYEMLQCCGCERVSLRHIEFFSEARDIDFDGTATTIYPPSVNRRPPSWIDDLPHTTRRLLSEVYIAVAADARALAVMGMRSIIDEVANDKVGDCGGFDKKLEALVAGEFISTYEKEVVEAAVDCGHAVTHRAHYPSLPELESTLDITEHLLHGAYVLREKAEKLRQKTPKRKK